MTALAVLRVREGGGDLHGVALPALRCGERDGRRAGNVAQGDGHRLLDRLITAEGVVDAELLARLNAGGVVHAERGRARDGGAHAVRPRRHIGSNHEARQVRIHFHRGSVPRLSLGRGDQL